MPRIIFITHDGARHAIDAPDGGSVMEAARAHAIPGIDADCGGVCACATCHVFVDAAWHDRLGARTQMEDDLLGMADDLRPTSRLACQILLDPTLDGITVTVPQAQH